MNKTTNKSTDRTDIQLSFYAKSKHKTKQKYNCQQCKILNINNNKTTATTLNDNQLKNCEQFNNFI